MLSLLPQAEHELWRLALRDARMMASDGDLTGGYQCLLTGLYRVMDYAAEGEPWADDLVRAYRSAMADYRAQYCTRKDGLL